MLGARLALLSCRLGHTVLQTVPWDTLEQDGGYVGRLTQLSLEVPSECDDSGVIDLAGLTGRWSVRVLGEIALRRCRSHVPTCGPPGG